MKSLLVDALRSAQNDAPDTEPDSDATADETSSRRKASGAVTLPDSLADDISLLATGVFQSEPVGEDIEARDTQELLLDTPDESDRPDPPAVDPAERSPPTDIAATEEQAARAAAPVPFLTRLARWSPLMCVATMLLAAGGFVLYQNLAGEHLNVDLRELSEQIRIEPAAIADPAQAATIGTVGEIVAAANTAVANRRDTPAVAPTAGQPRVVALEPTFVEPAALPESVTLSVADAEDAGVVTRSTRETVDDLAFASVALAYAAFQRGDMTAAEKNYRDALDIAANHPDALLGLAAVLQESGRIAESATYYARVLELDPASDIAAAALISMNDRATHQDAIATLKSLLQRYPDSAYLRYVLGVRYLDSGLWPEASVAFRAAHDADPANADYSYNLAISLERQGETSAAVRYFERALATVDGNSDFDVAAVRRHIDEIAVLAREST